MINLYNQYIKTPYESEIAIINTTPCFITNKLFYIEYKSLKNGFFLDKNDYLKKLYSSIRFNRNESNIEVAYLRETKNVIRNVQPVTKHYCYIKVLKDKQNKQLEGQTLILSFGAELKRKFEEYPYFYNSTGFDKSFRLIVSQIQGFLSYDKSHFTDNHMEIFNENLDLNSINLNYKTVTLPIILERREKLEKIKLIRNEN